MLLLILSGYVDLLAKFLNYGATKGLLSHPPLEFLAINNFKNNGCKEKILLI